MSTHTYSMVISYNVGGQFAQNIVHYQFDDGGYSNTADAAFDLCNAFDVAHRAHLKSILSVHTTILSYKGRALNVSGGFEGILTLPAAQVGTRAGNLMVSAVGPVAVLYPNGNAKQRGRVFLPGISDADADYGTLKPAYVTAFNTVQSVFNGTLTLAGGGSPVASPVVYSRLPLPATSRIVEYARLSAMIGTQRRRQRPA